MRRRLINTTLGVVLVVVAVLGVPLAFVETHAIETTAGDSLKAEAARILEVVELRLASGEKPDADLLNRQIEAQRYAVVQLPGQPELLIGKKPDGKAFEKRMVGPTGDSVTVGEPRENVTRKIRESLLLIFGVALLAVAAAAALAVWQARRLARPLTDLAETAERLGSGDPRPRHRRYGVPELDRVAEVLDQSAERIARMLTAERRLAADASHQLRTPLTALSMRLEEIIATEDPEIVKEEAAIALSQVERLTDVVQRLLTSSRRGSGGRDPRNMSAVTVRVDDVIQQQIDEWRPNFRETGRSIRVEGERGLTAVATPGALSQVLATLVENTLMHGAGAVNIRTRTTGTSVVVEVEDEGAGVPDVLGARVFERAVSGHNSTGLGLAVARDLAEADGGRLELLQQRPPVFAVFLGAYPEEPLD
ncbi:histidine kinase dimerization/phospho-acceptor domain-containing protein [Streptomyces sp. SID3343]|uniref:histidine kinase dimerization/phospho-acceptor domain-containing protein n=1 Tax=Streptomyces sp. SID3343 TaxID=2690260 RepID=UPI001369CC6D|nr:histidine kinase dimerization/phospho-acceptor domain-containing protein [Streptomyces sp. SID3343]MYW03656.1 two-component sensor histidine kinase [Streptomyces sp. SID3343]